MLARFRNRCLTTIRRKDGMERWLFRWRERKSHLSIPSFLLIVVRHRFRKRASIHILPEQLEFNIPTRGGSRTQFFGGHSKLPTAPLTEYPPSTGLAARRADAFPGSKWTGSAPVNSSQRTLGRLDLRRH